MARLQGCATSAADSCWSDGKCRCEGCILAPPHLATEVHMAGGVDQVDQVARPQLLIIRHSLGTLQRVPHPPMMWSNSGGDMLTHCCAWPSCHATFCILPFQPVNQIAPRTPPCRHRSCSIQGNTWEIRGGQPLYHVDTKVLWLGTLQVQCHLRDSFDHRCRCSDALLALGEACSTPQAATLSVPCPCSACCHSTHDPV
jgi:hypothetical protein